MPRHGRAGSPPAAWAAALATLLLGAAGPALPPERDAWIQARTANFTVFSDAGERRTVDIARRLERFRAVLAKVHEKASINAPVETFVYIFKDEGSLAPYTWRFDGRPVALNGYFLSREDANFIVLNGGSTSDPLHTVYHEFIHYFLANNLPGAPVWFSEGLAECYSTFVVDDKEAQIGKPVPEHIELLRGHSLMPLRALFAIGHDSKDYNEGDRRGIFYAESWALMHYLLWDKPERREQLFQFVDLLASGTPLDEAFARGFQTTFEKLEYELTNHVRQQRFIFRVGRVDEIHAETGTRVEPMPRDAILYRLGELLVNGDEKARQGAEAHFREGLRVNPAGALAQAGLGHLRDVAQAYDDAAPYYEKALLLAPDDYLSASRLAWSILRRDGSSLRTAGEGGVPPADLDRARELFERAIRVRPDFALAHLGLGMVCAFEPGGAASAILHLETARRLLPSRTDIIVNLVSLHVHLGNEAAARALVDGILARMNDREALAAGREALARLKERQAAGAQIPTGTEAGAEGGGEAGASGAAPAGTGAESDDPPPLAPLPRKGPAPGTNVDVLNRQIKTYNRAAELANAGDDRGAIAVLVRLLDEVSDLKLAAQTRDLLFQVREHLAREERRKKPAR